MTRPGPRTPNETGAFTNPLEHLALLFIGQEPMAPGRGRGTQSVGPAGAVARDPLLDGGRVDAQERGYVLLCLPLTHALNR